MLHKIFVYGSLRRGLALNKFLGDSRFLGTFKTAPKYNLHDLGPFPALSLNGETSVTGEVYEVVSNVILERLDQIEGAYDRVEIDLEDGSKVEAYVMDMSWRNKRGSTAPLVPGGDWVTFHATKPKFTPLFNWKKQFRNSK